MRSRLTCSNPSASASRAAAADRLAAWIRSRTPSTREARHRLHTQRHPRATGGEGRGEEVRPRRFRVGLGGHLGVGGQLEVVPHRPQHGGQPLAAEQRRGPAADEDGLAVGPPNRAGRRVLRAPTASFPATRRGSPRPARRAYRCCSCSSRRAGRRTTARRGQTRTASPALNRRSGRPTGAEDAVTPYQYSDHRPQPPARAPQISGWYFAAEAKKALRNISASVGTFDHYE